MKTNTQKEKRREAQKKWKLKNLEKVRKSARENARKRWKTMSKSDKEKILEKNRIRRRLKYESDPKWRKQIYLKSREWRLKNLEKARKYGQNYHQNVTKPLLAANPKLAEKINKRKAEYSRAHLKDKRRGRWAKKKKALQICSTSKTIKCVKCPKKKISILTFDHIRGKKSMGHDKKMTGEKLYNWIIKYYEKNGKRPKGLQPMCLSCNIKKQIDKVRRTPKIKKEIGLRLQKHQKNRKSINKLRLKIYKKMKNDPAYLRRVLSRSK